MESPQTKESLKTTHEELAGLDRVGIFLSALCLIHCVATSLAILFLPILARYYLTHPYFHWLLALLVVPVGLLAFVRGYRHHGQFFIFLMGIMGLFLVGVVPILFDYLRIQGAETIVVSVGSVLLVFAHWKNQRSCSCATHH